MAVSDTDQRTPLLLVRHGQTPWNVAGIWQGQADPGLTEEGRAQAAAVAKALAAEGAGPCWRRIVSSDLRRARETAEPIADALSLEVVLDARLRERDAGEWSGLARTEVERRFPDALAAFQAGDPLVRPGGGENTVEVRARALDLVRELADTHPGEPTILVTHLGLIRTLEPDADSANGGRTAVEAHWLLARARRADIRPDAGPDAGPDRGGSLL